MRSRLLACSLTFLLSTPGWSAVPQAPSPTGAQPQPGALLIQSAGLLTGSVALNDATLTGTAELIAGSDEETGTATYRTLPNANRLDLVLSGGTRSEIHSTANGVASGTWIGPDGTSHAMANHNLMTDAGWFPAFTLRNLVASSTTVFVYVGQETRNGAAVIHVTASLPSPNLPGDIATLTQHLTQVEVYLDATTLLPVSYAFSSHPDNNALLDIPTEIRYSNYQSFGGAQIPLHVQRYINNTLSIDLQLQNASLNTGITVSQISPQ